MIDPLFYNPFHKCWHFRRANIRDMFKSAHAPFHNEELYHITETNGFSFSRRKCRDCGYEESMPWSERLGRIRCWLGFHPLKMVHNADRRWKMCEFCNHEEEIE